MLTNLNEANLLENLRLRFGTDRIYTYTGSILMAMNPYKQLPLYGDAMIQQYRGKPRGSNPPHVYAMADRVHRALTAERLNQSIIVSGESGAGKTETCKAVMKFLLTVRGEGADSCLDRQILESNPILEALGNARTLRNDNSSRFGKFIKVHFDEAGHASGASIVTYLLEKSRLVAASKGERSYHCFYQLLAGATEEERAEYALLPPTEFASLARTGCASIEGLDDAENFQQLRSALSTVNVGAEQQAVIFKMLSALLWLGNVEYGPDNGDDEASAPSNPDALSQAAQLLGVNAAALQKALCSRCVVGGRGSVYYRPRTAAEAKICTDSMVKGLYGRLFDWVVGATNSSISGAGETACNYISVLDIYGFESYEINTLEQLCINYANEKLQQFFVQNVLAHEQEAYRADGVHCAEVTFEDNQPTVDLIEQSPTGIFGILDEVCRLPRPSDTDFTDKVHDQHAAHSSLSAPRVSRKCNVGKSEGFIVSHFAGKVLYSSAGFVAKNMDKVHEDVERLIGSSGIEFVASMQATEEPTEGGKGRKKKSRTTIVSRFSSQLSGLMEDLRGTAVNYIRCIKPTATQESGVFDCAYVLDQLRNNGTNEALELMHEGFPTRCPFDDLANRYRDKMPEALQSLDSRSLCEALLHAIGVDKSEYAIGVTQVWFKAGRLAFMDEVFRSPIDEIVTKVRKWLARHRFWKACAQIKGALRVVKFWRGVRARAQLVKAVRTMVVINKTMLALSATVKARTAAAVRTQSYARMAARRSEFLKLRSATAELQRCARASAQRRNYTVLRAGTMLVQRAWKARMGRVASRERAARRANAATVMQSMQRARIGRRVFKQLLHDKQVAECNASTAIQTAARGRLARKEYRRMVEEAERIRKEEEARAEAARLAAEEAAKIAAAEEEARIAAMVAEAERIEQEEAARLAAEAEAARVAAEAEEAARVAAEQEKATQRIQNAARGWACRKQYRQMVAERDARVAAEKAEAERIAAEEAAALKAAEEAAAEEAAAKAREEEEERQRQEAEAEAARLQADEEEAARVAAEAEAARLAAEEEARVAAEAEAALAAEKAAAEAARQAEEEAAAADAARLAEEEAAAAAVAAAEAEAAAAETAAAEAEAGDTTAEQPSEDEGTLERGESVEEMLPQLEEELNNVESLCKEISEASRPASQEARASTGSPKRLSVGANKRLSVGAGKRLSVGGPMLLDRLTAEDDKAIQDFLELNYETINEIDSLLQTEDGAKRNSAVAIQPPAAANRSSLTDLDPNVPSRPSISSTKSMPAATQLPARRDSNSKLPVARSTSSMSRPVKAGRTLSGRADRRSSEIPGAYCSVKRLH